MALLAPALATAGPAASQDGGELARLEGERSRLAAEIAAKDDQITGIEGELADLEALIVRRRGVIAVVGDKLERTVDQRRLPARIRSETLLADFTGSGREDYLSEIFVLEGNEKPARNRELYAAVIDHAQARVDAIDERLRSLAGELDDAEAALGEARAGRDASDAALAAARSERAALAAELEDVEERIEDLKARQTRALLTGLVIYDSINRPALTVKIDNAPKARPQAGINGADIVFVELVEGGLTRLAAVFHSQIPSEVGPVRSMRTGDFDLLAQFNSPLFANSGGNRVTRRYLAESTLVDVGVNAMFRHYYRTSRPAPHNLYTNPGNLWAAAAGSGFDSGLPSAIFAFRDSADAGPSGDQVNGVTINYGATRVGYRWDGSGWLRTQDGTATADSAGTRVAPTTVIVQFTDYRVSEADAESPEAISVGEGEAWILTDGRLVKGRWSRPGVGDTTRYLDAAGNEVRILPGRTWIEMPRPNSASAS